MFDETTTAMLRGAAAAEAHIADDVGRALDAGDYHRARGLLLGMRRRLAAFAGDDDARRVKARFRHMSDALMDIAEMPADAPLIRARTTAVRALATDARLDVQDRRLDLRHGTPAQQFAHLYRAVETLREHLGRETSLGEACNLLGEEYDADDAFRLATRRGVDGGLEGWTGCELFDSRHPSETAAAFLQWRDKGDVTVVLNREHQPLGWIDSGLRKALVGFAGLAAIETPSRDGGFVAFDMARGAGNTKAADAAVA